MAKITNSHRHKKFNRYTSPTVRKRGFSPYLIILVSAIAAVIVALLLGTFLGRVADTAPGPDQNENEPSDKDAPTLLEAKRIKGAYVTLSGILDSTAQNVRAQIPRDAEAVSLILFDENGAPYYVSKTAEAFGNKCGELTLPRVFDGLIIGEKTLYSSIIFPSSALNNKDTAKQTVMNAYEASLIEELSAAGACDVIITPFSLGENYDISENFVENVSDYVYAARRRSPELRIGLAITLECITDSKYSMLVEELAKNCDFLALDLTSYTDIDSFSNAISAASLSILRREMRLLLGETSEESIAEITTLLDKYSMNNYQTAKKDLD